ncbi:MAG TPA: hypothetical protein VGD65_10405 [Chryseosolibacter sp.]
MQEFWGEPMTTRGTSMTILQLRQLLIGLKEHATNTCVRVRMLGELWQSYFMRVVSVSDDRVLLNDEVSNKLRSFRLDQIMQVEIDHKFREFQPHDHYTIVADESIIKQPISSGESL